MPVGEPTAGLLADTALASVDAGGRPLPVDLGPAPAC